MTEILQQGRRKLPKLMTCMSRASKENLKSTLMYSLKIFDSKDIRRHIHKFPLHQVLIMELKEAEFTESAYYFENLLYDNAQLVAEDDVGIVVDLTKRSDYLEHICSKLKIAERARDNGSTEEECLEFLKLALYFAEQGKGILWLAEKFFLAAIAVASQYMVDYGEMKATCKYHYAMFLLEKFPGADPEEVYQVFLDVRDASIGKDWLLRDETDENREVLEGSPTIFASSSVGLWRVMFTFIRKYEKNDIAKAERLSRLAEKRANEAGDENKKADAIIEQGVCQFKMNDLRNATKSLKRALLINENNKNYEGICQAKMHLAAVMQRHGDYKLAAELLTDVGTLAINKRLRKKLGQALHLLGELHLKSDRPELGTQHLAEAFTCFMGISYDSECNALSVMSVAPGPKIPAVSEIQKEFISQNVSEIYHEEAEQSRLMMAISAGQEMMKSYFDLLREAPNCNVAKSKVMDWKLSSVDWRLTTDNRDKLIPCLCSTHKRTPFDVLWYKLQLREESMKLAQEAAETQALHNTATTSDLRVFQTQSQFSEPASDLRVSEVAT